MDRLVTDNLMNRLKEAANRQIFGKMFDVEVEDHLLRSKTGVSLNPRSPAASGSLPLDNKYTSQLLLDWKKVIRFLKPNLIFHFKNPFH